MNLLGMGPGELILIAALGLIVFGPGKLPEIAAQLGKMVRDFRQSTSEISAEFRRLIGIAMRGADAVRIKESLRSAEPVNVPLRVNSTYPAPAKVPLQSTPPTLLLNLPRLPKELQYRIVGQTLVLYDVSSNLIVDFLPSAIPAS